MTPKLDKDPWYYNFAGIPKSAFATSHARLHRLRRAATSKLFSTSYALRMQSVAESCVERLISKLETHARIGTKQSLNMSHQYWCMASEVVSGCMMPLSSNYLAGDDAPQFGKMFKTLARVALWNRHFPWLFSMMSAIPHCIVRSTAGSFVDVLKFQEVGLHGSARFDRNSMLTYMKYMQAQVVQAAESSKSSSCRPKYSTVPHEILRSSLPLLDKGYDRITQEATMIVGAGTEAAGAALSITTFYLLADPAKMKSLKQELMSLQPSGPCNLLSYQQLSGCLYLGASISEGLRLSKESNRMPRINHTDPTYYHDWVIPPHTAISMSLRDVHLDGSVFKNPRQFQPERWLDDHSKKELERFLVPFGKGSRGCVGMHLALVELYLTIGNLFHRFDMELYKTTEEDIRLTHDFFSLDASKEAQGLRVLIR